MKTDNAFERVPDTLDQASNYTQRDLAMALQRREEAKEPPEYDDEGNKICLDCGEVITPPARASISVVVCCLECQTKRERKW